MTTPTRWPEARARRGLVASPHVLASEAGLAVMRGGGNAVDAAIAAAATIAVVYPHMNGIGGDNFWLIHDARRETTRALRLERRFDPTVVESLRARGHDVIVVDAWSDLMGHAQVIRIDDGALAGGSDPRADGAALGW